jgi:hypothetical protein
MILIYWTKAGRFESRSSIRLPRAELHRTDGPALEYPKGNQEWWLNGVRHRIDGPAVIDRSGTTMWFVNGESITAEIITWAEENKIDLNNLTDNDKMRIKLVWS